MLDQAAQDISSTHKRTIRSFVLRAGRMTPSQQKAFERLWPHYGLSLKDGMLDLDRLFQRSAPRVVEIGFGMGDSLAAMARSAPHMDFIGIEVHTPGVGRLLRLADEAQLSNLRVYADDAVEVLQHCIPATSLSRLQLYFPDPWHKKKHHKRRIVQPDFVKLVSDKLAPAGEFHLATDWENYAQHMLEVLAKEPSLVNLAGENRYSAKPDYRPVTKFERRGERLGHGVWDLLFKKRSDQDD